ncbi:MAG: cbb3-type cytochrome c oxidase subunit II [Capsulimonadaceae bacterium]|nr:cbb3-type cytochrome c oxidase subunit II [Capsulimonadaceae bacterium]
MAKPKAEQSVLWLGIFASLTMVTALVFTAIFPSYNNRWSTNTVDGAKYFRAVRADTGTGYSKLEEEGRLVYQREGCMYCHTQQVRPLRTEMIRYGIHHSPAPPADEREGIYDEPHFLGTKRNGPDLSRVGGKYSDDWQFSHLYNPQQMVPGSIMPAFTWLFSNANPADPSMAPVPSHECVALVAYLQSLGADRMIWDPALNGGKGGYRPWLLPQDKQNSLAESQAALMNAAKPIHAPRVSQ